ncbi:hypothetical protein NG791_21210 [Laspinema sp. D1]|nr:hypothetical protein [Laspinema sp. D2b]
MAGLIQKAPTGWGKGYFFILTPDRALAIAKGYFRDTPIQMLDGEVSGWRSR